MPLKAEINNQTLAVLININDPESVEIGRYYQKARSIPDSNIIYLDFKPGLNVLTEVEFEIIETQLKNKVDENIQAYALAWRKPWRVGCMSITSAFSLGFTHEYCAKGCALTKPIKYFNSRTKRPYSDYQIRPSMLLSAKTLSGVKQLISRGVAADYLRPNGTAYLLNTSDRSRNVRAKKYPFIVKNLTGVLNVELVEGNILEHVDDVMFYFTGLKKVERLNENTFLPGAIADHLTSYGGQLFKGNQMSVLEWIGAGATGTYGTVVEPCNFLQKFPDPLIVIEKYLSGNSLIEAYWKSVQMPGQGVFVGEPLASPYKDCNLSRQMNFQHSIEYTDNFVEKKARNCNEYYFLK